MSSTFDNSTSNISPVPSSSYSSFPRLSPSIQAWQRPFSPGVLTPAELEHYFQLGYVVKENLLDDSALQPVIDSLNAQVDMLARALADRGKISDLCETAPFHRRLALLEKQFPDISVILHRAGVLPESICRLWTHDNLLSVARQVIGNDVAAHANWSLRTKTPSNQQGVVPWHQDAAYLDSSADHTLQMTAWIPLIDANEQNGCMQVMKGGHRKGVVVDHVGCSPHTWYLEMIADDLKIEEAIGIPVESNIVTLPVKKGSVLFLNNLIPHRSLPNSSLDTRWSIDLRWQHPDQPSGFAAKDCLRLSSSEDLLFQPSWKNWAEKDRHVLVAALAGDANVRITDQFDSHICGSWMDRWPLTKPTRHTQRWQEIKAKAKQTNEC